MSMVWGTLSLPPRGLLTEGGQRRGSQEGIQKMEYSRGTKQMGLDADILERIKKSLTACLQQIEDSAIILIDAKGKSRPNRLAKEIISRSGVTLKDFTEWIRIGSSQLQDMEFGDLTIHICRLPYSDVIAILNLKQKHKGQRLAGEFNLTEKQKEVLRYLLKGLSNREIANKLNISPGTVNTHLDNIYLKLGCSSRSEASLIALKKGLFLHSREAPSKSRGKEINIRGGNIDA